VIKKLIITTISAVLFSVFVSAILYFIGGESHRLEWGGLGTAMGILIYSGPFFLLVGIPFSYLVDYLVAGKDLNYIFVALLYVVSGIIVGAIIYLIFRDFLSLWQISIYYGSAALTLSLGLYLFDK